MILHDAVIENKVINENVIDSTEEFIDKLLAATDLIADVYINTHKAFSSRVTMTVNNGYMMANVDGRFALSQAEVIDSILIQVRQSGDSTIILSSFTMFGEMMDTGDYDADLYFKVISVVPNCTLKCFISDSRFKSLRTAKLPPITLYEQPVAPGYEIGPSSEITVQYIVYPGVSVMFEITSLDGEEKDVGIELSGSWKVNTDGQPPFNGELSGWEFYVEDNKFTSHCEGVLPEITVSLTINGNDYETTALGSIDGEKP